MEYAPTAQWVDEESDLDPSYVPPPDETDDDQFSMDGASDGGGTIDTDADDEYTDDDLEDDDEDDEFEDADDEESEDSEDDETATEDDEAGSLDDFIVDTDATDECGSCSGTETTYDSEFDPDFSSATESE